MRALAWSVVMWSATRTNRQAAGPLTRPTRSSATKRSAGKTSWRQGSAQADPSAIPFVHNLVMRVAPDTLLPIK